MRTKQTTVNIEQEKMVLTKTPIPIDQCVIICFNIQLQIFKISISGGHLNKICLERLSKILKLLRVPSIIPFNPNVMHLSTPSNSKNRSLSGEHMIRA